MKTKTPNDPEQYFERRGELDVAAAERIRNGKAKRVVSGTSVADRVARLQQESRAVTVPRTLSALGVYRCRLGRA